MAKIAVKNHHGMAMPRCKNPPLSGCHSAVKPSFEKPQLCTIAACRQVLMHARWVHVFPDHAPRGTL